MEPLFDLDAKARFNITCARGLAPFLVEELTELGHSIEDERETGVTLFASLRDAYRLNLCLRTAFHILYEVKTFSCRDADELYAKVREVPWERIVPSFGYLTVDSRVSTPSVTNSMYPNLKVKDAIVDRINEETGERPDSGAEGDRTVVILHWFGDEVRLYVDTSGRKLADRGYRKQPGLAPLRESLAAAIVMASGYRGDRPLVNPMCGSGTLAIEAALIGSGRAPGLLRAGGFAFQYLVGYDPGAFKAIREQVRAQSKTPGRIVASDHDPEAVEAARHNAQTAGVDHLIEFECCDFEQSTVPEADEAGGVLLVNPEYGERLGDERNLVPTYKRLGDFFKTSCQGYHAWLITGSRPLAKKVGLRANHKRTLWNGPIECRLLRYELYGGSKKQRKQPGADLSPEDAADDEQRAE